MYVLYLEYIWLIDKFDGERYECEKRYYLTEQEAIDSMLCEWDINAHGNCISLLHKHGFTIRNLDKDANIRSMMICSIAKT